MKRINIGIIGTGFGSKVHIPGFKKTPSFRILGIAGRSIEKTSKIAKENNIPLSFSSWRKMILDPRIQAVSIAVPPAFQREIATFAAKNKKHILCEKPLASSVKDAKKIVKAVSRAGVIGAVDFEFRYIPEIIELKKLLLKKTIGEIRHINIAWLTGGRAGSNISLGWQNSKKQGGGTLLAFGSHTLDYIEFLFGRIKSVSASLSVAKKNGATAEDTCDIILELGNRTTASISISNVLPGAHHHIIEVYGSNGNLRMINKQTNSPNSKFELFHFTEDSGRESRLSVSPLPKTNGLDSRLSMFLGVTRAFAEAIQNKKRGFPSITDGLRAQTILEAVIKSDSLGKRVSVRN